jgi:hypothetical protein
MYPGLDSHSPLSAQEGHLATGKEGGVDLFYKSNSLACSPIRPRRRTLETSLKRHT